MTFEILVVRVLAGGVAGLLAGFLMTRGGHGWTGDVSLGLIGSIVGSWLLGTLGVASVDARDTAAVVAFAGAALLILAQRRLWPAID